MNNEMMKLVEPEILKAVKTVVDENVPTGQVAMQMDDGTVRHFGVADWQARIKAEMATSAARDQPALSRAAMQRKRRLRERVNRRDGRRQKRRS